MFELMPTNRQKSFYSKAQVLVNEYGVTLYSYGTKVCSISASDSVIHRHWYGYSATTMKHVNSFIDTYSTENVGGKKWWDSLPVEA